MRLGEDARKCVVFFGTTSPSGEVVYRGTGFLVSWRHDPFTSHFMVTCRHVATNLDAGFFLRLNNKNGGSDNLQIDDARWHYHPDPTVDLAMCWANFDASVWDKTHIPLNGWIYDHASDAYGGLCSGDPIAIVGLFRLHAGTQRNVPIVHSGSIAALPDPGERIPLRDRVTKELIQVESYLIEAQTLDGLSGSPVFVRRYVAIPGFTGPRGEQSVALGQVQLLGIYQGSWEFEPGSILAADRNLSGAQIRVPLGMGMAVPSERILDMFKTGTLADEILADRVATTDSVAAPPANEAS